MRADRGYWCLPEVDLGLPLTPEMYAALAAHVEPRTLARAALTGERFTALDAVAAGIATEALPEEEVLPRAIEIAEGLAAKNRSVIGAHKSLALRRCHRVHQGAVAALAQAGGSH